MWPPLSLIHYHIADVLNLLTAFKPGGAQFSELIGLDDDQCIWCRLEVMEPTNVEDFFQLEAWAASIDYGELAACFNI